MRIGVEGDRVRVLLNLIDKPATPYVEAGNLYFRLSEKSRDYYVQKSGYTLDCANDIVKNANTKMFAVDYAQIGCIRLEPVDAPLVSFGESAIFRFNGGKWAAPRRTAFVSNLYNNMWGTNFPQWIEGDFSYEYYITHEDKPV